MLVLDVYETSRSKFERVLNVLARGYWKTVHDIAHEAGLAVNSAGQILGALVRMGLAERRRVYVKRWGHGRMVNAYRLKD